MSAARLSAPVWHAAREDFQLLGGDIHGYAGGPHADRFFHQQVDAAGGAEGIDREKTSLRAFALKLFLRLKRAVVRIRQPRGKGQIDDVAALFQIGAEGRHVFIRGNLTGGNHFSFSHIAVKGAEDIRAFKTGEGKRGAAGHTGHGNTLDIVLMRIPWIQIGRRIHKNHIILQA